MSNANVTVDGGMGALKAADRDKKKKARPDGAEARKLKGWLAADPGRASDHVLSAIARGRGHLPTVAAELGVSERTLDRILAEHPQFGRVATSMRDAARALEQARAEVTEAPEPGKVTP